MNRIVMKTDPQGGFQFFSDEPVEIYEVCDHLPDDRVYKIQVQVGVHLVRDQLRDSAIGHYFDDSPLGLGYGPKLPPSKRHFRVV